LLATRGIGSARVRKGVVDRGSHGIAGEIGLMYLGDRLSEFDKSFQNLAGYNQFAKFIDGAADPVAQFARLASIETPSGAFAEALKDWGEVIATGLLNAIYLLDPANIVIAGPLAVLYPRIQAQVDAALRSRFMSGLEIPRISLAGARQQVAAVGAAAMLRQELFLLPYFAKAANGA
jgi:predicted NBD/HSP70 family sugar kinase